MPIWDSKGPILAFFCNWAPYRCYMDLCGTGMPSPRFIYPIKVMCAGRVDPAMVLHAFEKGAEGVIVLGCQEKECRYGPGPKNTEKMQGSIQRLMHILGLDSKRFMTARYAFNESERLMQEMNAFAEALSKLKKSPLGGL